MLAWVMAIFLAPFILSLAAHAAAASPPPPASRPITVTGHAWAPFISPMGEPFRAHSPSDDTLAIWFARADRNRDGLLTADEMQADAARFFATLDSNHDGEIDPDELVHYEWEVAPDIQVMSRTRKAPGDTTTATPKPRRDGARRAADDDDDPYGDPRRHRGRKDSGLQGAARYGLLNMPEPVAAADSDFNRGISLAEFREAASARFRLLDRTNQGSLTLANLQLIRTAMLAAHRKPRRDAAADTRVGNSLPTGD